MQVTDKITITNEDNMELMARYPDNYFDLAIVDPPYGIMQIGMKITKPTRPNSYKTAPKHKVKEWDIKPQFEYWQQLFRVSKNQIVWGGNYFTDFLPVSGCWIFWDKINGNGSHFADGEFAWTNFKKSSKKFTCSVFNGLNGGKDRIHPTEKPVKLYNFILKTFAKTNDKILDTHLGSGSIAIACHDYGFELTACELDKEYYDKAIQRIKNHVSQQRLF
jgi:site-specific DNA-methyltransferase (adenine-specific)